MRYVYKMTSDLTEEEIQAILEVRKTTVESRDDAAYFQWKYSANPYGDSLHMIGYDGDLSVACVTFWRNDLGSVRAYLCVDLAVIPSHQRRGIFRESVSACVARLEGAYIYTYPNDKSRPGFLKFGWRVKRRAPASFHLTPILLRHYEKQDPIPDKYAEWRFVQHPRRQYYVCRLSGRPVLLSKRRKGCYAVAGGLSSDFGLQEVRPVILFSYDLPDLPFRVPTRGGYFLENPCYVRYKGFIPSYHVDTL